MVGVEGVAAGEVGEPEVELPDLDVDEDGIGPQELDKALETALAPVAVGGGKSTGMKFEESGRSLTEGFGR